ncbi:serine hydrolase domain-containing protein [Cytophaga sp. FL35]|uniref:serine hydrolase domain-containing protein n=1 Tax=Cytophaga sp. FL35 TaxID=1904456 RepID=UPI00165369D5|nr:serine hydrolase domain-containing protein [Cytophaga sp. FL35]MBC7000444.1 serine hydrolase [Cytophaga sp. FL35]
MKFRYWTFILCSALWTSSCSTDKDGMETEQQIITAEDGDNSTGNEDVDPMDESLYFPPVASDEWEQYTLNELNWNPTEADNLSEYLQEKGTDAFLVLKNGRLVIEWYYGDFTQESKHTWNSAGKTLTALMVGIAQEENKLSIEDPVTLHLNPGWTSMEVEKESAITVRNQLTMTTGLDYTQDIFCYDPECLNFLNDPNDFWYYHNAPYTLLDQVISNATGTDFKEYYKTKIGDAIGMEGNWVKVGYNNLFFSNARSMGRFGLLILNKGDWNDISVLSNKDYFDSMTNSSQELNPSYGYLWWLNGKESFRAPGSEDLFEGSLIPSAPLDLIAGLGANDQKLYVIPSENLVVVRLGGDASENNLGPSSFDEGIWTRLNAVMNP